MKLKIKRIQIKTRLKLDFEAKLKLNVVKPIVFLGVSAHVHTQISVIIFPQQSYHISSFFIETLQFFYF